MTPRSKCPINGSLEMFGDRWTLLILRDMMFSAKTRFSEFQASDEGIATNILSQRLSWLEDNGFIGKRKDPKDGRRQVYFLTEKGISLAPVLVELTLWGQKHMPGVDVNPDVERQVQEDREGAISALQDRLRQSAG